MNLVLDIQEKKRTKKKSFQSSSKQTLYCKCINVASMSIKYLLIYYLIFSNNMFGVLAGHLFMYMFSVSFNKFFFDLKLFALSIKDVLVDNCFTILKL